MIQFLFITPKMLIMTDTELYVVKGKVYEQKKGYSAKVGEDIGYEKGAKMIKTHFDQNPDESWPILLVGTLSKQFLLNLEL